MNLSNADRALAASIAAAHPIEFRSEGQAEPLCRYLILCGSKRTVIEAWCDLDAENDPVYLKLAQEALDNGLPFARRPVTCRDPETNGSKYEHDLRHRDGRDPDVKRPHYECRRCGECHEFEEESEVEA